jgi:hypothetical protein
MKFEVEANSGDELKTCTAVPPCSDYLPATIARVAVTIRSCILAV